jgi:hypothetical protein
MESSNPQLAMMGDGEDSESLEACQESSARRIVLVVWG